MTVYHGDNIVYDLYPPGDPRDGARIVRFSSLMKGTFARREKNGTGLGVLVLPADSADAQLIAPDLLYYVRVVRINADTSETVKTGFFLDGGQYNALTEDGTRALLLTGAGTLAYLAREIMWSHTYIGASGALSALSGGMDPFDDLWRLYAQGGMAGGDKLGAALWRALAEGQSYRTAAYTHTHGDGTVHTDTHADDRLETAIGQAILTFDGFTDSAGAAWAAASGKLTAQVATDTLLDVTMRSMQSGVEVLMDPDTFEVDAYNDGTLGADKTGAAFGAGVVRFTDSLDGDVASGNILTTAKRALAANIRRSQLLAGGQDVYGAVSDGTAPIPWHGGIRSDVEDVDALEIIAGIQIRNRTDAGDVPRLRIKAGDNPDAGEYNLGPGGDADVYDLMTLNSGAGQWDWDDETVELSAIEWRMRDDENGEHDTWVEFGSTFAPLDQQASFRGSGKCSCGATLRLCDPARPLPAPDYVRGWIAGEGGADGDASAIMDGDLTSGDGTGYFITKQRGNGGAVWMYWDTPVELTGYTMHQGFSPEDAQYGIRGAVQAGWRVYVNDNDDAVPEPASFPGSWVEIENAESSASVGDSVHSLSPGGAHRWYLWRSTVQDTPGALQIDWVIREIEVEGGSNPLNGTSVKAARCDHTHDHNDLAGRSGTDDHPASSISESVDGDVQTAINNLRSDVGSGAPDDVNYLVGTASGALSNGIVVGTTPGGELGGTWPSPTVDAMHSGSSHAATQAAAEATAAAALAAHTGDTTDAHDASAISETTDGDVQTAIDNLRAAGVTEAAVRDAGRWELAVITGSPPDPLYADGDYLYIWVSGA